MHATIYHNPDCGTSRNTLAMLRQAGVDTMLVHYLDTPPDANRLRELLTLTGLSPRELLRRKGTPYDALGLDDPTLDDGALIDAMLAHPILINRPIVVTERGARLCRPSEVLLELIDANALGRFVKEDGEVIQARTPR